MIEASGLSKRYGSTVAVDNLTFTVKPGIVTGFLGPNGSGKSTTMRMVLGLDTPTKGTITVGGKDYRSLSAPVHEVGALLDARAVHGGRSAYNHLLWVAQAAGLGRDRVEQVLGEVGLAEVAGKRVGGFSLGMQQRLGIATALLGDPPTLLFDEPLNGLDPDGIRWVRELVKRLAAEGRTVFVSSHLMNEMQQTAEHVVVIGRGKLVADAPIAELTKANARSHVRVVTPSPGDLARALTRGGATVSTAADGSLVVVGLEAARIGDIALEQRIGVHELTPKLASLEAAFMDLTHDSVQYRATEDTHDRAFAGKRSDTA
ncbi:ATP-binding cassette domain-containing protein [Actinokineospora auranticolor]|uniref:ABC transporter ATP-binding protein n=1 Tax=Actinokineospora auranticolor TaxID=155976 RepID=UPI000CEC3BB0|nr:ATP-binding cassette domain-containing protein [Actinokineospora auranticolor]